MCYDTGNEKRLASCICAALVGVIGGRSTRSNQPAGNRCCKRSNIFTVMTAKKRQHLSQVSAVIGESVLNWTGFAWQVLIAKY